MTPLEALALKMHATRREVERLRLELARHECQHELAAEIVEYGFEKFPSEFRDRDGERYEFKGDDRKPCWKGEWESSEDGTEDVAVGDNRDGGWCGPCEKREKLREPYGDAKRKLGALKTAFWRTAKRLAEAQS